MEEQLLFTRIHDALDIPVPPGAYERLRTQLTKKPVRPFRWPALQTRWSKMSFRFAAGLAIIAIAVAAAAAAVAIHNSTNNISPAGSRMSIQAYQQMVADDNANAVATFSAPCDVGIHSGCGVDAARGIPEVQKWIADISRTDIPTNFVVINAEMRQHLLQNISAQRDLLAASKNNDGPAMDRAFIVAVYAANWTNTVIPLVYTYKGSDVNAYKSSVAAQLASLDACVSKCTLMASIGARSCATNGGVTCYQLFDDTAGAYATFSATLVEYAVPTSLSDKNLALQSDLAAADGVLITMRTAVGANDQASINLGIDQLKRLEPQIDRDAAKITG
jgi:hypothetical protein